MTNRQDHALESFLDLPAELRHMIHGHFFEMNSLHRQFLNQSVSLNEICVLHRAQKLCVNTAVPQSIASLRTIGVMSEIVHRNEYSFFYVSTEVLL
ncbi:uncharacterized protein M421DRAFT_120095 [Didymella exigua CBS 183.55]|uniref:Uncharacterized protein n=1 Tax=Didymella exigua CBS 183.55 TaxID=1150837 RepID=A0A6A5S2Q8_9PLEO|nr:uncharacterized protein M421DRAFT_120095 [Didymella exigua CBS 183.55]KAF1934402.1 hypothetical protein M421DRAFT_120095 [Didymella exigua CBS 183.55]